MKRITYEWTAEPIDENGDIIDNDFADTPARLLKDDYSRHNPTRVDRGLVKDYVDEFGGTESRAWAYIVDNKLPDEFDDGSRVPQRFHKELAKALAQN